MIKNRQIEMSTPIVITGMIRLFNLAQKTPNMNGMEKPANVAVDSCKALLGAG